ncbi:aldo/keto reductase [Phototrophicus methaneseepsis]|uniref:Aldo/keto reductase n=1 Tax=Phototrophicus methaneseepsis TaxID=2710758 RepID=A0A7S8EAV7_9CHLR|nr:aldo/keto reductase [Phototrophicus methaneseepsis]QPC83438.1 aldo/keto reductase [Phototrophicus methaneseepsis]
MEYRPLGSTGYTVSTISFGAWAIGGSWGSVDDDESIKALHTAIDNGVNFIDTADVYGDGRSEKLIAQVLKERSEDIIVATKAGRRLDEQTPQGYNRDNITKFIERSLKNLDTEALDIVQLHCPPTEVYYMPEVFGILDDLKQQGKIKHYGVSVEKAEEAIKAIAYPGVETVQIIFNMFRLRPSELFFELAKKRNVGILARVPLASGMLTGKMNKNTQFEQDDHRNYNRNGEAFDVGETFSGVDYDTGLHAVSEIEKLKPENATMAQFALRWILMFDAVTCAIPGAKNPKQAIDNAAAADLPPLPESTMTRIQEIYDEMIREEVHHRW